MLGTFHLAHSVGSCTMSEIRVGGVYFLGIRIWRPVKRQGIMSRPRGRECGSEMKLPGWRSGQGNALGTSAHLHFLAFAHIAPIFDITCACQARSLEYCSHTALWNEAWQALTAVWLLQRWDRARSVLKDGSGFCTQMPQGPSYGTGADHETDSSYFANPDCNFPTGFLSEMHRIDVRGP